MYTLEELKTILKREFPYVEFEFQIIKKNNQIYERFLLKKYLGIKYEQPIKTCFEFNINKIFIDSDLSKIRNKMFKSFPKTND
jgi:hypothetical protein